MVARLHGLTGGQVCNQPSKWEVKLAGRPRNCRERRHSSRWVPLQSPGTLVDASELRLLCCGCRLTWTGGGGAAPPQPCRLRAHAVGDGPGDSRANQFSGTGLDTLPNGGTVTLSCRQFVGATDDTPVIEQFGLNAVRIATVNQQ